jgi:hypothetical protein
MSWITRGGEVLAALDECGPGWQHRLSGAVLLRPPVLVPNAPAGIRLDVAWCKEVGDGAFQVRRIATYGRWHPPAACLRPSRVVLVATAGAFERWRLAVGDEVCVDGGQRP